MGKGRILVVEDDVDISKMLRIYFDSQGYEVLVAGRGSEALDTCRAKLPNVVVLDIQLPDIDGYEVCRSLRSNTRTSYVPIIFLTQKDERSDKIAGLELGADDYITKPFDIEELKLRVEGAIRRSLREALTHPVTNLPAGKLIEEQLKKVKESSEPWSLLYFGIRNVWAFKEVAGPIQVNEVLIFLADIMRETVESRGTINDFIGQASDNDFMVFTSPQAAPVICRTVTQRFDSESEVFYPFRMRETRKVTYQDMDGVTQEADLMRLVVGVVSSKDGPFADIVQITEDAAENRRRTPGCPDDNGYGNGWGYRSTFNDSQRSLPLQPSQNPPIRSKTVSPAPAALPPKTANRPETRLAPRIVETTEETLAEAFDYFIQLKNQADLWQSAPLLFTVLFKINSLTSGKIHDMSQIGHLLDLAMGSRLPQKTLKDLQKYQQLCFLAYQNLNELRFKVFSYEDFESALLNRTIKKMVKLLPELKVGASVALNVGVAIPERKLCQLVYNIYKWLELLHPQKELSVRLQVNQQVASLTFTCAEITAGELEKSILLVLSDQAAARIVYGYLVQKIVSRYRGSLKSSQGQIVVELPLAGQGSPASSTASGLTGGSTKELKNQTEKLENFLKVLKQGWEQPSASNDLETDIQARSLAGVIAEDLLFNIETMLGVLQSQLSINSDNTNSPWSAIWRKLSFFQILTTDLQKNYRRKLTQENLKELLDNVTFLLTHRIINHHVTVDSEVARPYLYTDRMRLLQIFVNLGLNALEAMPDGGSLKFHIKQFGNSYLIYVADTGRGISPENLARIFDLGFTTKVKGSIQDSGRGIGLYSVNAYVQELNGSISVCSELGKGTTFTVNLPIYRG